MARSPLIQTKALRAFYFFKCAFKTVCCCCQFESIMPVNDLMYRVSMQVKGTARQSYGPFLNQGRSLQRLKWPISHRVQSVVDKDQIIQEGWCGVQPFWLTSACIAYESHYNRDCLILFARGFHWKPQAAGSWCQGLVPFEDTVF